MSNELAKMSDVTQTLAFKLRLSRLDRTQRILQKNHVIDSNGFLTIDGAQVFLDAMWQKNPDIQKEIAEGLAEVKKDEKKNAGK
jgi:hypothetical protein